MRRISTFELSKTLQYHNHISLMSLQIRCYKTFHVQMWLKILLHIITYSERELKEPKFSSIEPWTVNNFYIF